MKFRNRKKKIKCMVCEKNFEIGNNPLTGLPNGIGMTFKERPGEVFNVCSFCISYRNAVAIRKAEAWKMGIIDA